MWVNLFSSGFSLLERGDDDRKRKLPEFAVTSMEKLEKSIWVNLFLAGFSLLERGNGDGSRPPASAGCTAGLVRPRPKRLLS